MFLKRDEKYFNLWSNKNLFLPKKSRSLFTFHQRAQLKMQIFCSKKKAVEIIVIFHKHVWNFYIFYQAQNIIRPFFSLIDGIFFSAIIIHKSYLGLCITMGKKAWKVQSKYKILPKKRMKNSRKIVVKIECKMHWQIHSDSSTNCKKKSFFLVKFKKHWQLFFINMHFAKKNEWKT